MDFEKSTISFRLNISDNPRLATSTKHRNHGHRTYRAIGARVPEATSHILELQVKGEVPGWKGWTEMVQGRWIGIPNTEDCD
jgi:hypothetical protein